MHQDKDSSRRGSMDDLLSCGAEISTRNYESFFLLTKDLGGFDWRLAISFKPDQDNQKKQLRLRFLRENRRHLHFRKRSRRDNLHPQLFIYDTTVELQVWCEVTKSARWIWLRCQRQPSESVLDDLSGSQISDTAPDDRRLRITSRLSQCLMRGVSHGWKKRGTCAYVLFQWCLFTKGLVVGCERSEIIGVNHL